MTSPAQAPLRMTVEDRTQVSPARSAVRTAADRIGLSASVVDRAALAATELAQNLHLHATGGELIIFAEIDADDGRPTLTMLAVDRGPGVERFDRCLVDGYTTGGTMGTGLGAVQRLAADFDGVSEPGLGTIVFAQFTTEGAPGGGSTRFDIGALGFPLEDDEPNGDGFTTVHRGGRVVVLVADGLGHGPQAADASRAATHALGPLADRSPGGVLREINQVLAPTRGAAVSVASLDLDVARDGGELVTSGMGNVSVLIAAPDATSHRVATAHGTVGARPAANPPEHSTTFPAGGLLVLHTDGLHSRWTLDGRSELLRHRSVVIATALWRDHQRKGDDSLVVVVKANPARSLG